MSVNDLHRDFLDRQRKRFAAGDRSVLLYCVNYCIVNDTPAPTWLQRALVEAYRAACLNEIKSWDEVFGKPLKKGQRQATARRNASIRHKVFQRVEERSRAGEAVDKTLFAAVGKEFGVGGTVASDLYYGIRDEVDNFRKDCK